MVAMIRKSLVYMIERRASEGKKCLISYSQRSLRIHDIYLILPSCRVRGSANRSTYAFDNR